MFGILYGLTVGIANFGLYIKTKYEDLEGRKRGIQRKINGDNIENVYFDHRGRMRDIDTNKFRNVMRQGNDIVLEDENRKVIRNLSEEKREADFQKAKSEVVSGTKAIFYKQWTFNDTPIRKGSTRIWGDVYRDIKTNQLYLVRTIRWNKKDLTENTGMECGYAEFYMDPYTAKLIDVSDQWKHKFNPDIEEMKKFINYFNNEQERGGWKDLARTYGSIQAFYIGEH